MEGLGDAEGGVERELVGGGDADAGVDFDGVAEAPAGVRVADGVVLGPGLGAELGSGITDGDGDGRSVGVGVGVGVPIPGGAAGGPGRTEGASGANTR
ncbi:hypothetical protein ACFCZ1_07430 [Streptomyces sp. NPDC056224]|uniref:hypothetical protein n=1 Tax=Streptomyces sp. NPDC056224 TaxID=3345750 RepID=UPI0035E21ED7